MTGSRSHSDFSERSGRATIASPAARHWIGGNGPVRVLNVFSRVINLTDSSGEIVSFVRESSLLGPFAAVVPGLQPGLWTAGPATRLRLPTIDPSAAEWNPRPDWKALAGMRSVDGTLSIPGAACGASRQLLDELARALTRDDTAGAAWMAARLAGAGSGLTPESDDVLVGAMHAVWAMRPEEASLSLCGPLAEAAAPRTTLLSAAWLRAAARGEAAAPWHALLAALAASRGERSVGVDAALQGVLAMGETSGAAALSGFVTTLARFRG